MSRGPQAGMPPPPGAITVWPGQSIQQAINAAPPGAGFRLGAGVHQITELTPKMGNVFVGDYGAILDGTGWTTSDLDAAAFKALNVDVDNVVIRNLEIRNMPQKAVMAWRDFSSGWVLDYLDINHCKNGVEVPANSTVMNSKIQHCVGTPGHANPAERGGGYSFNGVIGIRFLNNEVAYNGTEQKWILCTGITCAGNFFHHNAYAGPWIDGGGAGSVIEDNICDDNTGPGMVIEIGDHVIIRRNSCNRSVKEGGILLSMSQFIEVYENTLAHNVFGIDLFIDCVRLSEDYPPHPRPDLQHDLIRDNVVTVGAGQVAAAFTYSGDCGAPYEALQKDIRFERNKYTVPDAGAYWIWGNGPKKTFQQWQALGFDLDSPPTEPPPETSAPELPDTEPEPPPATCTLNGQTYAGGATTEVAVKKGKADEWAGQHPDWRVLSVRPHPKNKTQVLITVQCQPS